MKNSKGHGKSWKVMESHGKVIDNDDNVMEFLLLH